MTEKEAKEIIQTSAQEILRAYQDKVKGGFLGVSYGVSVAEGGRRALLFVVFAGDEYRVMQDDFISIEDANSGAIIPLYESGVVLDTRTPTSVCLDVKRSQLQTNLEFSPDGKLVSSAGDGTRYSADGRTFRFANLEVTTPTLETVLANIKNRQPAVEVKHPLVSVA